MAGSILALLLAAWPAVGGPERPAAVVCLAGASFEEVLAAREVCRYVYLRTGRLLPITASLPARGDAIVVARKGRPLLRGAGLPAAADLGPQEYLLTTSPGRTGPSPTLRTAWIVGGHGAGVLYGAYRFAERLGVRFALHGDVLPDATVAFSIPDLDERGRPLFGLRGIQPFHDFAEGPDWWSTDDYKAVIGQLPKLRMNFIGLHTYPAVEPCVWVGLPEDVGSKGEVRFAYPVSWMSTARGGWGDVPKKTGTYAFGASQLFESDDYGPDVMAGHLPHATTPEGECEVFNRAGEMLREAFTLARCLGVKTCVGTETPLSVPRQVARRIAERGPSRREAWVQPVGGRLARYNNPITGTPDEPAYQSVRFDLSGYRLRVPNGLYTVTLQFSEVAYATKGARVFGVTLQGKRVIDRLDIFAEVGKNAALDRAYPGVEVSDGRLEIGFVPVVEFPCIAAIAVEGERFSGKVNCGGGAWKEYQADDGVFSGSPADIQRLYEGTFRRIARTYPIDYYWMWTPEGWTWEGASDAQVEATAKDLQLAVAAAKRVKAPFTLATCGWVLGPPKDRSAFDSLLPKEMPFSCINRQVGNAPVEPGFARVQGRPKWAIPWLEDDPTLTSPQLWAGRMRKDAVDALRYGCTGLMGIHWRTRVLDPNVAALADAAWSQEGWTSLDEAPAPRREGPVAGITVGFPDNSIAGTEDAPLYQSVRYGMAAYHFAVPDGEYTVTLRFCEPHYQEAGRRVFGVKIQGKQVLDHLDLFARVGRNRALDCVFPGVRAAGGWLDVEFPFEVEYPCVAAISIEGAGVAKRVNCGGPAYKEYGADRPSSGEVAPAGNRSAPAADFYRDWATAQFGPEVGEEAGEIFARVDGRLPKPSAWVDGPGGLVPSDRPWEQAERDYTFLGEFEALRPRVKGARTRERFDYWLSQFRGMKAVERVKRLWAQLNDAMKRVNAETDAGSRARLAEREALPLRRELVAAVGDVYGHLLTTVSTPGEMGTVDNWERHILPALLDAPGKELAKALGRDLPPDAQPGREYAGPLRVIVPTVRGSVETSAPLRLKVIVLSRGPVKDAAVYWRPMGRGEFTRVPLSHVARGVYRAQVPGSNGPALEYYVEAVTEAGETARFPAGAPEQSQTVVVLPRR